MYLKQWSSRCTLVHISVHENYLSVHKIYGMHEICFGVQEIKFKSYTRCSWVEDEKQKKKGHRYFFLENLALNIMKNCTLGYTVFYFIVLGAQILFSLNTTDLKYYVNIFVVFK